MAVGKARGDGDGGAIDARSRREEWEEEGCRKGKGARDGRVACCAGKVEGGQEAGGQ